MARRPRGTQIKAAASKGSTSEPPKETPAPSRADLFVAMIDHLTAAKQTSDATGEKFLSYLLSMAIQETRMAMRGEATSSSQ